MCQWSKDGIVYVVDDDEGARDSVAALIEAMELICLRFSSGEQLVEFLRGKPLGTVPK